MNKKLFKKIFDELRGDYFEGVVIKMKGGKSFKVISKVYDSKKS